VSDATRFTPLAGEAAGVTLLVYGAYGYTGELVAREAAARGHDLVLAGRSPEPLADLGDDLDRETRVFPVGDAADDLAGIDAVLHCAGPFAETATPMVDACLATGTDYLDITGEFAVFERLAERHDEATAAGVTLLPGVGFDVVPTDCLAAHLAERLPEATELALGVDATGGVSPGTLKTALGNLGAPGVVRRDGRLKRVPAAWKQRRIDFGRGPRVGVTVPWGDVSTAFRTTGVPTVEVYFALPRVARLFLRSQRYLGPLLATDPVQEALEWLVDRTVEGPDESTRETARTYIWGEVTGPDGEAAVSRLRTPETYALTVEAALACAERTLDGEAPDGYATPAGAFGADLVLDLPGVERVDGDPPAFD
jgi:short subunit dehydrogenase-like uncharacterized protein